MQNSRYQPPIQTQTQLTIQKALQFAGDNSTYQKKRLLILSIIILSLAILTCKIPFMGSKITMMFLICSGLGQIICPIYLSLGISTLSLAGFSLIGFVFYPFSQFITDFAYCGMGFFGRGVFVCSLIYLNQIGGDRFRAWSMIVIFAIWGISSLFASLQKIVPLPTWMWYYVLIFIPFIAGSYFILKYWTQSPFYYYNRRMFTDAKSVLNEMAQQNNRAHLPYGLQGQKQTQDLYSYKQPTYFDIINHPILRKITIPLLILWIYRQYIYYGSFTLIPQLSNQYSKNYILISISETVAVLMSYPIRLKIKRVNAFFGLTLIIAICSFISSFTTMNQQCMEKGYVCSTKYIYRVSIMLIRFSIALIGNILISYTLQIYPSNVRNMGFGLCLGVSSIGSIVLPWVNQAFIHAGMSGFIVFAVCSFITIYFVTQLTQTFGRMCGERLEELEKNSPLISLKNWATLNF